MTGRSLHDALLSVLCDSRLRRDLPAGELGAEEAAALARADPRRLARLARFLTRHFYRERLLRLFRHSCALARREGLDPLALIDRPETLGLLDDAKLGSPETAGRIASSLERWFLEEGAGLTRLPYWPDLVRYEGAMYRAEAGRRIWREPTGAAAGPGRAPARSDAARIIAFDYDLPSLAARLDLLLPDDPPPAALLRKPTRLLFTVSPRGVLRVIRCNDALERFWATIDGLKDLDQLATVCGMDRSSAEAALKSLVDVGAIEV